MAAPAPQGGVAQQLKPPASRPQGPLLLGRESVFLSLVPFVLLIAVQYASARAACIAGTASAAVLLLLGLLLFRLEARQCRVYILDVALLVISAVMLGVGFVQEDDIANNLPFIANGSLALASLVSMVAAYPFTMQHLREMVPRSAWRQVSLRTRSFLTSALFVAVFATNTLLYLIPVAKGLLSSPSEPLNYCFRILVPIVLVTLAAITTRLATGSLGSQVQQSLGFDDGWGLVPPSSKIMVNPLAQP